MKKLVVTLLMSCVFVGTVSAADSPAKAPKAKETALWALENAGTRLIPAAAGLWAANAIKNSTGSYGFLAFLGLASIPFVLDTQKVTDYKKVPLAARTALNSFGAGAVAYEAYSLAPTPVQDKLAALIGR